MAGWISLHRRIQDHWLWKEKPFDKRSAWIDILLMANHKENKFLLSNELIEIERGSFITSEVKLAERWGWSRTKVRSFLELLEKDNMIIKISDNKKTTLTVVNYSDYQDIETTKEQQKNSNETSKEQQKNTNNNDNNVNNVNKEDVPLKKEKIYTKEDKEYLLAEYLSKQIAKRLNKPLKEEKDLQRWAADFNKMVRLDNYDIEEIKQVLMFSQKNDFWQTNILSAAKFRKQYLTLLSQMKRDEGKGKPDTGKKTNKFHNFIQNNEYTGDDLEAIARKRFEEKIKKLGIATEEEK